MRGSGHRQIAESRQGRSGTPVRRVAALLAGLAIFLQAFVVQTHVDGLVGLNTRASIESAAATSHAPAAQTVTLPGDAQAPCLICQVLASSGNTLLAQAPALTAIADQSLGEATPSIRRVVARPAYSWQSRAPPIVL